MNFLVVTGLLSLQPFTQRHNTPLPQRHLWSLSTSLHLLLDLTGNDIARLTRSS